MIQASKKRAATCVLADLSCVSPTFMLSLINNCSLARTQMYYTYAYLREDKTPYYIGKGKGNRINDYHSKYVKLPPKDRRLFLKQNLSEESAFRHEIYMIALFGRKDLGTGILINRSDGGDNPPRNNMAGWNKGLKMNFPPERGKKYQQH